MSYLFVNEKGASIHYEDNYVIVRYGKESLHKIPVEDLEAVYLFSYVQITSQCVEECLKRRIYISYFSGGSGYFGRLASVGHVNVYRQRKQLAHKINTCHTISEIMGYEGNAARLYFDGLSNQVHKEFAFKGRSKRPLKDEFNSMLSFGYFLLMNEIYAKLENKGLNPYFGFIHSDREKHPTLASDMMEEWRATIVDSIVMSLINGNEIHKKNFICKSDADGFYLTKEGLKIFLNKYDNKMKTVVNYLDYIDYAASFRTSIDLQINQLAKAIEEEDASVYHPIWLR